MAEKWCVTNYKTFTTTFQWTVKKFHVRCAKKESTLDSPVFTSGPGDKYKWQLWIHPGEEEIILFLGLVSQPDEDRNTAIVEMAIYANGKVMYKKELQSKTLYPSSEFTFYQYGVQSNGVWFDIARNSLVSYLVDNSLTIHFKVCVFMLADPVHITGSRYLITVPEHDMCTQFGSLLSSGESSDVTLVVGREELMAHKLVLSTRSPVFKTMFEANMKEKLTNCVKIEDIELPVLQEMLTFIYTGKSPNLKNMASELLFAADKYQLDRLKLMCEEELCSKLNENNASQTLELADRHNATQLKEFCSDFIAQQEAVRHGTIHQAPFVVGPPTKKRPRLN